MIYPTIIVDDFFDKLNFNDRQIRYSLTECKRLDK